MTKTRVSSFPWKCIQFDPLPNVVVFSTNLLSLFLCFDDDMWQKELINEEDKSSRLRKAACILVNLRSFVFANSAIFVA